MRIALFGMALFASAQGALAQNAAPVPQIPMAARFGALEAVDQASLSPDGTKLAIISPLGEDQVLKIVDLVAGGQPKPIMRASRQQGQFQWCSWATGSRLICSVGGVVSEAGTLLGFSRMVALNSDGSQLVKLTKDTSAKSLGFIQYGGSVIDWDIADKPGHVLMTQAYVPEKSMGTHIYSSKEGMGVDLVDSVSLKRKPVEAARRDAVEYITDGHGTVRILGTQQTSDRGYVRNRLNYYYRKQGDNSWQSLSVLKVDDQSGSGFNPVAVDAASNVVFGFDDNDGRKALFSIALDGTGKRTLVLGRPDVDVDGLIRIGRDNRVVGASYATERRRAEYFDPELKVLTSALSKALPGRPGIDIVDASEGEKKLLIAANSDTNPGLFYLYDKSTHKLEELLPRREGLDGVTLAPMKAITYAASDGTQVPAYLTLPPGSSGKGLPAIVMPHGGPSARDEWGFDWLVQFFAVRGYAVIQPNYRGSSGYGSSWYQQNGFKSWRIAIGDVNDAGRWLVKQGIADPGKLGIVGWSYGGYAALQSQVLDPDLFKAVVAIAPVTDLERLRQDSADYSNFSLVNAFIGNGPHVREGSPAQNTERFKAPVMLFHGDFDMNVAVGQSRLMNDRLKGAGKTVTYVEFPGLAHSLLSPAARTRLLGESDAFLRKAFGLPAE